MGSESLGQSQELHIKSGETFSTNVQFDPPPAALALLSCHFWFWHFSDAKVILSQKTTPEATIECEEVRDELNVQSGQDSAGVG